jgi:hypothetical protein
VKDGGTSQHHNLLALCLPCHNLITKDTPTLDTQRQWKTDPTPCNR